ncbi:MAG: InlB B-repeat-containing protein [Oscillospiraceae bacterium]|nr:InlB B-repeat-containing protein [Oscillospiraceae bacterium]
MKRFLAIVIAAMLVVGMLPTAFATETTGGGYKYNLTLDSLINPLPSDYYGTSAYGRVLNQYLRYISWKKTIEGIDPAVDTTKTDSFATTGRNNLRDINPGIYEYGFAAGLKASTNSESHFEEDLGTRPFCLFKIEVPEGGSGKYTFTAVNSFTEARVKKLYNYFTYSSDSRKVVEGAVPTVHMVKITDETPDLKFDKDTTNNLTNVGALGFSESTVIGYYDSGKLAENNTTITDPVAPVSTDVGEVELDAGEYYVLFDLDSKAKERNDKSVLKSGSTVCYQLFLLSGIELTPVADEEDDTDVVDPGNAPEETPETGTTSYVKFLCGADGSTLDTEEAAAGSAIEYTAPDKTGYTFLYWAQGIGEYKKIVSYDAELSLKAEKGAMWLTAVYSDNSLAKTEVVFYNANGDEISRSQYEEDSVIDLEDLPSMAGFGEAAGWTLDTDGETYTAEDKIKASGKLMRFVAEYADAPSERFDITVVDGTAVNGIADDGKAVYGETVTVTAESIKDTKYFNYWQKDGEIVSFDLSYSFKPYKDTTVTAVYNDNLPVADTIRKIIIGTRPVGLETAAVAEFIGISDAVEKGILFGTNLDDATHKISMKTDGDTFSVINDVAASAIGYAILSNGNAIYSK